MDTSTWLAGLIGSCGVGLGLGCVIICRDHMRRITNLEIIITEKVIGSGLARGLRQSDCQQSDGLGDGPGPKEQEARQAAAAWASAQAVQDGVEAYRRGYRPF